MNNVNFKYKNDYFYNILAFFLFIIFILVTLIIFKYAQTTFNKILYILLTFIIINVILAIIDKTVSNTSGNFIFDKHSFIYDTLHNEYTINYQEIEYITKEIYTDSYGLLRHENYMYVIKIKNAGSFVFRYTEDNLVEAIEKLCSKAKLKIEE